MKGGRLWCGEFDATEHVNSVRYQARDVDLLLSRAGIPAGQVSTMLVLINSAEEARKVRGIAVVGSKLSLELVRLGTQLTQAQITELADELDQLLPPNVNGDVVRANYTDPHPPQSLRVVNAELVQAAAEAARRGDIESWMSWLHPNQATLTATRFAGPARLRGPAGTGKTVVALHRAHVLASGVGDKVLMLAPTKNTADTDKILRC